MQPTGNFRNEHAADEYANKSRPQFPSAVGVRRIYVHNLVSIGGAHVKEAECQHERSDGRDDGVHQLDGKVQDDLCQQIRVREFGWIRQRSKDQERGLPFLFGESRAHMAPDRRESNRCHSQEFQADHDDGPNKHDLAKEDEKSSLRIGRASQ